MADKWYNDDPLIVRKFLGALIEAEYIDDLEGVQAYCSKPNQFSEEFAAWEENGNPESDGDDGWDDFTNALAPSE